MPLQLTALRFWVRLTSIAAPRYAERFTAKLFLTPRKRPAVPMAMGDVTPVRFDLHIMNERLVGWRWGRSDQKVLLVHGWSGRAADMTAIASELASRGFEAIAIDMPAHGSSEGTRTNLVVWSRLLPAIGRELGPFVAAIGHSFGGAAVTLALDEELDAARAVLIAPPLGPHHFMARLRAFIGLPSARTKGMERELERIVGRRIETVLADRTAVRLSQPALIIHDPADDEVPFSHGESIAAAWRGSTLVRVLGAGHYRILKSPETIERVASFVSA